MKWIYRRTGSLIAIALAFWGNKTNATAQTELQTNLYIYTDRLVNGFQDWSWGSHNLTNTSPVHSGSCSISFSDVAGRNLGFHQGGFNPYQGGIDVSDYADFSFWANGGTSGGQEVKLSANYGTSAGPAFLLGPFPANQWRRYTLPLSALGIAGATNVDQFNLQLASSGSTNTFYLDDIELTVRPAPTLVHVSLNADRPIRTADSRWFGLNTGIWDGNFDTLETMDLLREVGATFLRFPGGSLSDDYHWATDTTDSNTWRWATSFASFANVLTNIGAQAIITVNYGTGTPAEAAAWVRDANITNHLNIKYWEIGNECYGGWETDSNTYPHDPYTYAVRAADYITQMKAADPTIKIGVVATPGQTSSSNGYTNHPATNLVTGQVVYGWTPVVLSTFKSLGVTPDFLVDHRYPECCNAESDPLLLQSTPVWAGDAADLRAQINDYFGGGSSNIALFVTENNAGGTGRQSTSLVDALYYADSLGQLMQTEFNAFVWWALRNGSDTNGYFDPTIYGWRNVGDFGMVGGATNRYPAFYAAKLMQHFARGGDAILTATSDFNRLSAYASRHADGSVSLLVINKDLAASAGLNGQISLNGFVPGANVTMYCYGMAQDDAAETGVGSPNILQTNWFVAGTNFSYTFPPYSLTLFTFPPAAPKVRLLPSAGGDLIFQIQGQQNTRYVLQSATNLTADWTSVATNTLPGNTWDVTNAISDGAPAQFWRAEWLR